MTDFRALPAALRLTGHDLILREWTADDIPAMAELFGDPEIDRWTPLPLPFGTKAARDYIDQARAERERGLRVHLAITEDGDTPLGEVVLIRQYADDPGCRIAYTVTVDDRGRDLASRALRAVTAHVRAFGMWPLTLSVAAGDQTGEAVARAGGYRLGEVQTGSPRMWIYGPDARPGGTQEEQNAVWSAVTGMYQAFQDGTRNDVDAFMHPDATMWDTDAPQLVLGKLDLDRVRDARPAPDAEQPKETLTACQEVIDVFDDLALARYWLNVEHHDGRVQHVRNTAVLARVGGDSANGWLLVHLHEDEHAPSPRDPHIEP